MTDGSSKQPLRLITSQVPPDIKSAISRHSRALRKVDSLIMHLPDAHQKMNLSIAVDELVESTGGIVGNLLAATETNARQRKFIQDNNAILTENVAIMQKLHHINKGLWSREIDTILEAILYIERTMQEQFPGISTRIILEPQRDRELGVTQNPIAQMLADTIEMVNARFSDEGFEMTTQERVQKEKLDHLISLLPIFDGALSPEGVPSEMNRIEARHMLTDADNLSHVLTRKELAQLDMLVFGTPGSALAHHIPNVGEMIFLSNDPTHYDPTPDTMLLTNAIEILGIFLAFIGKNESNKKDLLTGLPLRRGFEEKGNELFEGAKQKNASISFAFIDADHFKKVNDTYGHAAGDLVLKTLAKILIQKLKAEDVQVRWGGEEFGVLMQTDSEAAGRAMQRVFDVFKRVIFQVDATGIASISYGETLAGNRSFSVTLSAGVAGNRDVIVREDANNATATQISFEDLRLEDIIREADKRLYVAKKTGRDRIVSH